MPDNSLSLPDYKTLFEGHVYTVDFLAADRLDLSNPDPNVLRRGFLVLGRYHKPTKPQVVIYLQQTIQRYISSPTAPFDPQLSPLIAKLTDQQLFSFLKGNSEQISSSSPLSEENQYQHFDVHYFTVPAPLYIQQGKKVENPEWYHDAFRDKSLQEQGLHTWFLLHVHYQVLLQPQRVAEQILQSNLSEKEGIIYAMKNICKVFSPPEHFARMKDINSRKIKEAALETLVQATDPSSALSDSSSKSGLDLN